MVKSGEVRLKQVLFNLTSYMIKWLKPSKSIDIITELVLRDCQTNESNCSESVDQYHHDHLVLHIIDTGSGIKKKFQPTLFDNMGSALNISQSIVSKMGGKLTVLSTRKQGTKFTFTVELSESRTKEESSSQTLDSQSSTSGGQSVPNEAGQKNDHNRLPLCASKTTSFANAVSFGDKQTKKLGPSIHIESEHSPAYISDVDGSTHRSLIKSMTSSFKSRLTGLNRSSIQKISTRQLILTVVNYPQKIMMVDD